LVTASGARTAATGSYRIEVTSLAKAQKLGSTTFSSASTALALTPGSFTLNGATITVDANDSLTSLRDKINNANTGTNPSKVSASVLQVDATHFRLILTSEATGAAGMTFANVSGGVPQALGLTNGSNVIQAGAVLVAGQDASFKVDGVSMTRTSNTVTDAIQGVTLNLVAEEAGAVTMVTLEHSADTARTAMQTFADSWNKLVDFVKTQQTAPKAGATAPTLYNDALSRTLLQTIGGAAADLSTAGLAGLSLGQDGKLTLNTTKFDAAFKGRLNDLRVLFSQVGTTTDSRVTYLSSSSATTAGTYAVNITQAATQGTVLGTGFSGLYADDATADTMAITESRSGATASIQLTNGATTDDIVTALNTAFAAATKQKVGTGSVLYGDVAGTVPMTGSTTFASLRAAGGGSFGVVNGQSVSFSGKRSDGSIFSNTFTITDASTKTIGDLVSQIQAAYGSTATVSVSNGSIVVEDSQARTSALDLTVTANNEGGGTLSFGASSVLATGRPALSLTATNVGGQVQIATTNYGSRAGFTVAYTAGGADGTAQLGVAAAAVAGLDVQGTLGGFAATGSGQTLVGATGTAIDGLTVLYSGTATGSIGDTTLTLGTGALLQRSLDQWLVANSGTLATKESSLTARAKSLEDRALRVDDRLTRRRESLLKQYAQMETALARFQSQSTSITALLNSNKSNG
jgi:flagellar hook-associated protein 2